MVDVKAYLIQHNRNWAITTGQVLSIEEITGWKQTMEGGQLYRLGYKIEYSYIVDSIRYEQSYFSGKKSLVEFARFIKPFDNIEVYYKKKKPKESYINMNINSDFYKKE